MTLTVKQFLAQALLWKAWYKKAASFRHSDFNGGQLYTYEGNDKYAIFQWARKEFPFYNRYSTNEELTQHFFEDFKSGNSLLLKEINTGATTELGPSSTQSSPSQALPQQQAPAVQQSNLPSGGTNVPPTSPKPPTIIKQQETKTQVEKVETPEEKQTSTEEVTETPRAETQPNAELANYSQAETTPATTQEAINPAPSPPQMSTPSFQSPKIGLTGFKMPSAAKDLGSSAGRFIKINSSRIGAGITGAARIGLGTAAPSLGRIGNGLLNGIQRISQPGGIGGGGMPKWSKSSNRLALALIGGLMLFVFLSGVIGISGTTPSGEAAPLPPVTTNLSSCKFTRAGNPQSIKSSILLGRIVDAAASAGISAQVLASVAMHENPDFTANADNNHDAIKSNQFCNKAPMFCEKNGQVLHSIDGKDDPCTTEEIANGARNAQAVGLMQNLDIYNPGKNLCSITESLRIAAAKLKADGLTMQPTQAQINKAINTYYNSCTYGSYSYCNEVWNDLQNCQTTSGTAPAAPGPVGFSLSCPVGNNFTINCGTATNPVNNCGHGGIGYTKECDPTYYACNGTRYSDALYHAIDVVGSGIVTLPFVNGNEPAEWTRIDDQPIPIGGGSWGYRINYQTTYKEKRLLLDLTHLNNQINSAKTLKSGEQVGTVFAGIGHLHFGLSVDGQWVEPIQEVRMCGQ